MCDRWCSINYALSSGSFAVQLSCSPADLVEFCVFPCPKLEKYLLIQPNAETVAERAELGRCVSFQNVTSCAVSSRSCHCRWCGACPQDVYAIGLIVYALLTGHDRREAECGFVRLMRGANGVVQDRVRSKPDIPCSSCSSYSPRELRFCPRTAPF